MIKQFDGYYVDEHGNRWSAQLFSRERAEALSKTLVNCKYCDNCLNCQDCTYCTNCVRCMRCTYCTNCVGCLNCRYCDNCSNCIECVRCTQCVVCQNCTQCTACEDFKENPERIVGFTMGRRADQPVVYWLKPGEEQCVVGCFRGTLAELETEVKKTHKDNQQHLTDYLGWINAVRKYQKVTCKKGK